ncbi:hypothetical protein LB467_10245, partial [Salegentibacter sp. JZCK2]|uniref:hypothetical protein n=1 Tax=Salegentibacter tibetensis TaxID=2873600 RepID=UPI001CC9B4D1
QRRIIKKRSFKERVTLIFYIIAVSFKVALFDRNRWHHHSEIATNDELYNIYEKSYNSKNDPVRSKKYHLKEGDTIKIRIEKNEYDYDTYDNIKEHRLYTEDDLTLIRRYKFTY